VYQKYFEMHITLQQTMNFRACSKLFEEEAKRNLFFAFGLLEENKTTKKKKKQAGKDMIATGFLLTTI
jgi:hypothetical protein